MSIYSDALDQLAESLEAELELPVTRDPSAVTPPCVYIGAPSITGRTAGGAVLQVPVHLVADSGLSDSIGAEWLYANLDAFITAAGLREAEPRQVNVNGLDHPTYLGTTTLTVRSI